MNKENIKHTLKQYLLQQGEVMFAYLFGSFVQGKQYRDIDIAIYTESKPELIRLGIIQAELSQRTRVDTDLTCLNNLPAKNPSLAYDIVTHGMLLFSKNSEKHTSYKKKALMYYFDTAPLRKDIEQAFSNRLASDKFGARNYE